MTEGIDYTERRDGNVITVTAIATDGYVLSEGVETTWTFDVTPAPCACTADPLPLDEQFTMTYTPDSQTAVSLGGFPAGWLAELDAAGAEFSITNVQVNQLVGYWMIPDFGQHAEVFSQVVTAEREALVDGERLSFDLALASGDVLSPAESVEEQAVAETERLRIEHDVPELQMSPGQSGQSYETTLTVTVVDSCGATRTREITIYGGGGVGV